MTVSSNIKTALLVGVMAIGLGVQAQAETEKLVVAGGCFWCVESDFESVPGVIEAVSGYTGGHTDDPTYKQIGRGDTGHFEAVEISFDNERVSRERLLHLFLRSIDATDAGGQFCDRGAPYRTAVFVTGDAEKALANATIAQAEKELARTIVTPVLEAKTFYQAEEYHQDYYKGDNLVFTRFGPKRQSSAYEKYRKACGRDKRVLQLWGDAASFAKNH